MTAQTAEPMTDSWRMKGCNGTCTRWGHDPIAHEEYGRMTGRLSTEPRMVRAGDLVVDITRRRATLEGEDFDVHTSNRERQLLMTCARQVGVVVPYEELTTEILGRDDKTNRHNIRIIAGRLKARLGASSDYLKVIFGYGIMLEGEPIE